MRRSIQRGRRQGGFTAAETIIAAALLALVLGGAIRLLQASESLASSTTNERNAAMRVERTLAKIGEEFRKGSLSTALHLDGTDFADGDTGTGFAIRPVTGWQGTALLGNTVEYRLDLDVGALDGELVRSEGALETTLATGITAFSVDRADNVFTFTISARSGPEDDRGRTATGSLSVMARNP